MNSRKTTNFANIRRNYQDDYFFIIFLTKLGFWEGVWSGAEGVDPRAGRDGLEGHGHELVRLPMFILTFF